MSNPRSPSRLPPLPGVPSRYRLIHRLGQTPWTHTFLAFDTDTPDRPHCVIRQWLLGNSQDLADDPVRQALLLEVATMRQFEFHPQVPQIRDCFEVEQCVYTIRDHIPGQGVDSSQRPQRWSELESLRVLRAALMVLAIAHQRGLIHGNLHPHNLILHSTDSRVVLTDFRCRSLIPGISSPPQPFHRGALPRERLSYIAPEQRQGHPCPASDLYALGRIIAERLTGLILWQQSRPIEVAELLHRSPKPLSARLRDLLIQMTTPAPGDRLPSAMAALAALNADRPPDPPFSSLLPERSPLAPPAQWPELLTLLTLLAGGASLGWRHGDAWMSWLAPVPPPDARTALPVEWRDRLNPPAGSKAIVDGMQPEGTLPEAQEWAGDEPSSPDEVAPRRLDPSGDGVELEQAEQLWQQAMAHAAQQDFGAALLILQQIPPRSPRGPQVPEKMAEYRQKREVQARHLLQQAFDQAEARKFEAALAYLHQIDPTASIYPLVQQKMLDYQAEQRVRTDYWLFRANNRATVRDYMGAILLLKQIPPSNPAYGQVQEKILAYGAAQRSPIAPDDIGLTALWPVPLENTPPPSPPQWRAPHPLQPGLTVQTEAIPSGSKFQYEPSHIQVDQHP